MTKNSVFQSNVKGKIDKNQNIHRCLNHISKGVSITSFDEDIYIAY